MEGLLGNGSFCCHMTCLILTLASLSTTKGRYTYVHDTPYLTFGAKIVYIRPPDLA